jgi:hypothetical protein
MMILGPIALAIIVLMVLGVTLSGRIKTQGGWAKIVFCDILPWHTHPGEADFDGCSFTTVCPRCKQEVSLDSQGNWYT